MTVEVKAFFKNNVANIITFLRMPFAVAMLFFAPFSVCFWVFYFCGGITDIIDGIVARKMHQESVFGAKLDSVADFVFAIAIAIVAVKNFVFPIWLWCLILLIALLRLINYGIGFFKFHTFASLHTYANKITGVLLFIAPVMYVLFGLIVTGVILCVAAFASTLEELILTIQSKELERDCKSIFIR